MAGENIDAKFEAQNAKIDALRWMTGGLYLLIPIAMGIIALMLKS